MELFEKNKNVATFAYKTARQVEKSHIPQVNAYGVDDHHDHHHHKHLPEGSA